MLFSSIPFLFYFLVAVLIAYFAVPGRFKNLILLLASLFFYAWGEPKYVVLMLISITQGYAFGLLIEKYRGGKAAKLFLSLSVLVSLGLLAYFKYADFFLSSVNAVAGLSLPLLKLALPIGISFYTFQVLSYVIDVYRGETAAQRSFIDLAAYVSLFPQLIAGPIVRYSDVAAELSDRTHSLSGAADGARRFVTGLCKKVLLANQFGSLAAACKQSQEASVLFVWLYALAFLLQVYFDFSGYSAMAIGLGRILCFHFPETFNYPYTIPQAVLSKEICETIGMDKVMYQNSGAEANEAMIKIARKWGIENIGPDAWHIITAKKSFHGRTFGAMTATGQPESAIQTSFPYADAAQSAR